MAAANVKEVLKRLVALQKIDAEVYEFKREIKAQPELIADLKTAYDKKRAMLDEIAHRALELELARKAKELDLKSKEQDIIKANTALMTLKTNKEYQAKLFEIENLKADKSLLEDEILKSFDESSRVAETMSREKQIVDEEEKIYLSEKAKVDAAVKVLLDKVATYEGQRLAACEGIDAVSLAMYERLLENRLGLAMVPIVNDSCGGCFMKQTAQMLNQLTLCSEVTRCETCARILYLESAL
ncbi:MAG: C4-type zinc ribbon domain-containing protein [Candidatus Omnitrophota bacterium]